MVFFMAIIFGDVQYTQNGTLTNPCQFTLRKNIIFKVVLDNEQSSVYKQL